MEEEAISTEKSNYESCKEYEKKTKPGIRKLFGNGKYKYTCIQNICKREKYIFLYIFL